MNTVSACYQPYRPAPNREYGIVRSATSSIFTNLMSPYDCRCERNRFRATCEPKCPIYEEMAHRAKESEAANIVESYENRVEHRVADEIAPIKPSIKDAYNNQFEKAMEVAQHHLKQWVPQKKIANLLNESGFKTRTGKKGILFKFRGKTEKFEF